MYYPEDFTEDDILQFDYDWSKWCDEVEGTGQFWQENRLLQELAVEDF